MLARGFSKSYLRGTWEGVVRGMVELTVRKIKEEGRGGGPVNILKWWTFMATDVSSHLMFGDSFHAIERGEVSRPVSPMEIFDFVANTYFNRLTHTSKHSKQQCRVQESASSCH